MTRILLILTFISFVAFTVSSTAPGTEATFPGSTERSHSDGRERERGDRHGEQ
jgi:hypothetical protein